MIQRIQSLYLLAAGTCSALLFFLPIARIGGESELEFSALGYTDVATDSPAGSAWLMTVLLSSVLMIQFVSIFLFKNRRKQAVISQVSLVLIVLFVCTAMLYQDIFPLPVPPGKATEPSYHWSLVLAVLSWIFNWLAVRAIRKDEALLRSVDRLR